VVINEVAAKVASPGTTWVELRNTTNAAIDVSGWFLSNEDANLKKYQFPAGTFIPANGYLVLNEQTSYGQTGNPAALTPFTFDGDGKDTVILSQADASGTLLGYRQYQGYGAADAGQTLGRVIKSTGDTDFVVQNSATPGADNAGPVVGPVVINEVMYGPIAAFGGTNIPNPNLEYNELRNVTGQPVLLYDQANPADTWRVTGGINFTFPQNLSIPAYGYVILTNLLPADFRSRYPSVPAATLVLGPVNGFLDNAGETFRIQRPGAPETGPNGLTVPYITVDELSYDNKGPWPTSPNETGPSLIRKSPVIFGDDATDWQASPVNGGSPGRDNLPNGQPVVDAGADASVNVNDTFTRAINFTDGPGDLGQTYTATVSWGDGTPDTIYDDVTSGFLISHVFQGTGHFGVNVVVTDDAGGLGSDALLVDVKQAVAPVASTPQFLYASGPQRISIAFSADVSASLLGDTTDLTVHNLDDNTDLPGVAPTWDAATKTATWTFASLPDGNYRMTLHKEGVTDAQGVPLAADDTLDFWFLNGDANRDRTVDFNDLVPLAQNYNTSGGKTYAQGDFNGDDSVDFNDLVKLAQNYNTSLPGTPAPSATTSFSSDLAAAFAMAASKSTTSDSTPTQTTGSSPKPTPKPTTGPTPKPTPKPAPKPVVVSKPAPVKKPKPAAATHAPAAKAATPVRAAKAAPNASAAAPVAPSVFGTTPIKTKRDVLGLFA
jgi:hypothetical protein